MIFVHLQTRSILKPNLFTKLLWKHCQFNCDRNATYVNFSAQNREHSLQSREKLVKLGTTNLWTFVNTAVSVNKNILSQVWETSISFIEKSLVQNLWTFVNVVSMNRIILSQMCEISISFIEELSLKFVNICEDVWESSSYMNMTFCACSNNTLNSKITVP